MTPSDDATHDATLAAKKARDKVAAQLLQDPRVSLIDIGWEAAQAAGPGQQRRLAVRVHLKSEEAKKQVAIPEQVDGIPVRVIVANYQLE